jgi:hypothetical protein
MKEKAILEKIFVSQDNQDIRSKIKALIGNDIPSIIEAWANYIGYQTLYNNDITELLLKANILDDEFAKFLQSLQAIKSTKNRMSKQEFLSLFKELIFNTGYMYSALPYIEDIITYLGHALYLVILSGLDVKPFSFMLLKAKHQQATYKNPQNQAETINQLEYTAHPRIRSLKVKQAIKPTPTQTTQAPTQTQKREYIAWPPDATTTYRDPNGYRVYPAKQTAEGMEYWDGYEWHVGSN